MSLQLYARLTKVNEATRRITGVIASEAIDRSKEVFDYASSKPHFESWSSDIAKATDGKSLGNVRAMHGKVAAGRLTELQFDDAQKMITVEADIVDDNEWNKVLKGCYTGFSIGGKYVRKWTDDDGNKRYEAMPHEVSIVDLPCNKDATFVVLKAAGGEEEVHFDESVVEKIEAVDGGDGDGVAVNKAADDEDGDEAPEEGDLRLTDSGDVEKFVNGEWSLCAKSLSSLSEGGDEEELRKGCYTIARLASLAEDVAYLCHSRRMETWDGSSDLRPVPESLKTAATALYDALIAVVNEDADKAKQAIAQKAAELAEGEEELRKQYDARASVYEMAEALAKAIGLEDIGGLFPAIEKVSQDNDALRKENADLRKRWEAAPAPAKGALKTVEKSAEVVLNDGTGGENGTTATASVDASPEEVTKTLFRDALRKGVSIAHMPRG